MSTCCMGVVLINCLLKTECRQIRLAIPIESLLLLLLSCNN